MSKYLIKLQPLDTFFFGQENKYRKKKLKENKQKTETVADYFQRSAYFPQQTALLGTLRYCLLQKNGQIPINNKDKALELIGERSFQAKEGTQDFGKIKSLSSVFIINQNKNLYFQNPKVLFLEKEKDDYNIVPLKKSKQNIKSSLGSILYFENYVEKKGLNNFLIYSESDWLYMDYDKKEKPKGVFIEQEKIGITKSKTGEAKEDSFYKQIVYKLNKGFSFGFIAEIDDELDKYNSYVKLGADNSPFKISFGKWEGGEIENEISLQNCNAPKIVLLSDAYLSDYNTKDFAFAISNTKTFRFLKTEVKEGHKYYSTDPLKKNNRNINRSDKYNLIERGSVFFFNDEEQLEEFVKKLNPDKIESSEKNFYQIGYNNYKIIK